MEQKPKGGAVQVVSDEVRTSLTKRSGLLTGEEERALRMRHGAAVDLKAPLARAAGNNTELADELLLIEMQLMRAQMQNAEKDVVPRESPTKSKIVRALRRKR
jgi:hypothetical protein